MSWNPLLATKFRASGSQVWQAIRRAIPLQLFRRQRIRISFDIDDTLACQLHHCAVEGSRLPACVHRWLGEPLRIGTRSLTRELRRQGCSIWVYTSSGRTPSYIRRWLLLYGIRVDGVVNSVLHNRALTAHGLSNAPSKFPPASISTCMSMIPRACGLKGMITVFALLSCIRRMRAGRRKSWMLSL